MDKLSRTTDPFGFTAISKDIDADAGMNGITSILFIMDINFDGVPEVFAGTASTIGGAEYDVFAADGTFWGNVQCTDYTPVSFVIDNVAYETSGVSNTIKHIKYIEGLPSISSGNHIVSSTEEMCSDVTVRTSNGEIIEKGSMSIDDLNNLYVEYFNISWDVITNIEYIELQNVQGYLQVPDPENYTEEDIYNCLYDLLTQYTDLSVE